MLHPVSVPTSSILPVDVPATGGGRGRRLTAAIQLRVNRTALPFSYPYVTPQSQSLPSNRFNVGRGVPLRTQARKLVCTAKEYFQQEKQTMGYSYPLPKLYNELQRPWE
ncbi:hypothetical protein J6590_099452 [Homalodisca vitripennis]|nr:hypothetical protein J6590_099452 [Homalodisca vitripennis]